MQNGDETVMDQVPPLGQTVRVRLALIVNPAASSISGRERVRIQRALSDAHEVVVRETSRRGHATRLAHRASKDGCDVVVTLGGDGTVNEAANGLLGSGTALVPLPGGSTNVFARAIGYPNDAVEATRVLLDALAAGSIRSASLGMANDRAFVFHVGVGFDADVVTRVEERGSFKRYAGHPWFIYNAIRAWSSPQRRQLSFDVFADDGRHVESAQMAVAMNVNPYTFLGNRPLDLAPEVSLGTPLSVVATTSLALRRLLPVVAIAAGRRHDGLPDTGTFRHWSEVQGVTIRADRPVPFQLDGEPQPAVCELRLRHLPDAVRIVVPPDPQGHRSTIVGRW